MAGRLAGMAVPWWVAGGWALDLWRGEQTRPHHDIEICTPRATWSAVRERLAGHDLWCAGAGRLTPLPAGAPAPADRRQVWVYDPGADAWRLDVMLDPADATTWVCHRDGRVRRPLAEAVGTTADGIPYLRPEIVLLLKARHRRPKDEADMAGCLPSLDAASRAWLAGALAALEPDSPWRACV
ncbi:MAG TPA: amino acid transporter [Candidatus Dormibacteraeota bacterium]|nr:amino acid transporter [Candidatus Dormibacteraeota bacterium]